MRAPKIFVQEELNKLRWIIIDDRLSECERLSKRLCQLNVKSENISVFVPDKPCDFEKPATNTITTGIFPSFDFVGDCYTCNDKHELKKWICPENDVLKFYHDMLYNFIKNDGKAKFVFLIDLDFNRKPFCGLDILTLLRKTLTPLSYQVRFISNMPRKFMCKFLDTEFGNNLPILGDNNHLSFVSKASGFNDMPLITKDNISQFSSFKDCVTNKEKYWIYGIYDSEILSGVEEVKSRCKIIRELENDIKKDIEKEKCLSSDIIRDRIDICISQHKELKGKLYRNEIKALIDASISYCKPSYANAFGYQCSLTSRKDIVYLSETRIAEIKIGEMQYTSSEIYHVYKLEELETAIELNQPMHVVINLDSCVNPWVWVWEIERITQTIFHFEIFGYGVYFVTSKKKDEIEKEKEWKAFKACWKPLLCSKNKEPYELTICSPIFWKYRMVLHFNSYRKFIHDIQGVLREYGNDAAKQKEELDKIKQDIEALYELTLDKDLENLKNKINDDTNPLTIENLEKEPQKIAWVVVGTNNESIDALKNKLETEAVQFKKNKLLNNSDTFNSIVVKEDVEDFKTQINTYATCDNIIFLFDNVMPCFKFGNEIYEKAITLINNSFNGKHFACRILERGKWALKVGNEKIVFSDKKKYSMVEKTFKLSQRCKDFFIYSCRDDESFFTIDRLYFMREDMKNPQPSNLNAEFYQLRDKIDENKYLYKKILKQSENRIWQKIGWETNYSCDAENNEKILMNRICILRYVYDNLCMVVDNFSLKVGICAENINGCNYKKIVDKDLQSLILDEYSTLKNMTIEEFDEFENDKNWKKNESWNKLLYSVENWIENPTKKDWRAPKNWLPRIKLLKKMIETKPMYLFEINQNLMEIIEAEGHGDTTLRNFFVRKYDFRVKQKTKPRKKLQDKIYMSMNLDSVFEYEKDYLRQKYAGNDIVQAGLNS